MYCSLSRKALSCSTVVVAMIVSTLPFVKQPNIFALFKSFILYLLADDSRDFIDGHVRGQSEQIQQKVHECDITLDI